MGQIVAGRYRVQHRVGRGGMAEVYLAEDLRVVRPVALKVPLPGLLLDDPQLKGRFLDEIRKMTQLDHPHIVKVYDVLEWDDRPVAALQYFSKGILQTHGGASVVDWLVPIADALDHMHARGLVHRDVKPGNIFFDSHDTPCLGDLGIAKSLYGSTLYVPTQTGMTIGTPEYMSPEAVQGWNLDGRADQYALAVMVYQQLAGCLPFDVSTPWAMMAAHLTTLPRPLSELDGHYTAATSEVLARGLAKDRTDRFDSCAQFAAALLASLERSEPLLPVGADLAANQELRETESLRVGETGDVQEAVHPPLVNSGGEHIRSKGTEPERERRSWWRRCDPLVAIPLVAFLILLFVYLMLLYLPPRVAQAPFHAKWAKRHQREWSRYLGVPIEFENTLGMTLVLVPPGEFLMGSPDDEPGRDGDEGPQHQVRITRPIFMAVHEVTQEQYEAVMGTNPSHFKGRDRPVEYVSWNEAAEFCRKLSIQEQRTYRLPTEAEWESSCRAGTVTPFNCGETISSFLEHDANFNGQYAASDGSQGCYLKRTTSVGSYRANPWGLHDMHGNVTEWCLDGRRDYAAATSKVIDPKGPEGDSPRVCRGGNWFNHPRVCRSASRSHKPRESKNFSIGFRVVLDLAE